MSVITIDTTSLGIGAKQLAAMSKEFENVVQNVLDANIEEMDENAKQLAPTDRGAAGIRGHISHKSGHLTATLTSGMPYSAYMEFGTGIYAAQYVSSLPSDWQQFAAQFKGSKKTSIKGILFFLTDWFHRHGINDKQHAFFIARKIFINGVRAHPFLYPAFRDQQKQIKDDMNAAIKSLIK